jgi:hypothetical protein
MSDVEIGPEKTIARPMNVIPPPNYVERFPHRGSWTPAAEPPPFGSHLQLLFANGEMGAGIWTGNLWWGGGGMELQPLGWWWVENFGMSVRAGVVGWG